jgi:predicted O-methyltransferase YrrM
MFTVLKYIFQYRTVINKSLELDSWKTSFCPPGHYYSPFPDKREIELNSKKIFDLSIKELKGINMNEREQYSLLEELSRFYQDVSFPVQQQEPFRYYFENQFFSYSDAIFLFCLIRSKKPKRIIEIGSGYSSALMLDTNEKFFSNNIELTFIEPYPEERFNNLIKDNDKVVLVKDFIQNIPPSFFEKLDENDILFIDSSHVSKTNSDVNYLIFEILPILKKGVIIHFHDVFYPFEYPKEWIMDQRAWNEAYLLRGFLQYNDTFSIMLYTSFLENKYKEWMEKNMPDCLKVHEKWTDKSGKSYFLNTGGQSIYLRKLL